MNRAACAAALYFALTALGCGGGADLNKTHDPDLLDDKVLQQRVEAALHRAGDEFQNVHVHADADHGKVYLSGSVHSGHERERAESISQSVYGVKEIEDAVHVK
ncbi:MAG TPA: BON domain-containing protein [Tepidisphaeraceae bacterium]|jgi:osmotically-inducible protein OsmY|nr:BON domain-containing protein [Tepidisphaeraceae bacterium]